MKDATFENRLIKSLTYTCTYLYRGLEKSTPAPYLDSRSFHRSYLWKIRSSPMKKEEGEENSSHDDYLIYINAGTTRKLKFAVVPAERRSDKSHSRWMDAFRSARSKRSLLRRPRNLLVLCAPVLICSAEVEVLHDELGRHFPDGSTTATFDFHRICNCSGINGRDGGRR